MLGRVGADVGRLSTSLQNSAKQDPVLVSISRSTSRMPFVEK